MSLDLEQRRATPLSKEEIDKIVYMLKHGVAAKEIAKVYCTEEWVVSTLAYLIE